MGLYKTIKENNIYIAMHRSTPKDAYLYFDLSEAITHSEKILCGISETIPDVTCMDDLLNYFALKRIEAFAESIPTITDEANRKTIQELSDAAGEVAKRYSTGTIIKYINCEHESLFGNSKDGVGCDCNNFPLPSPMRKRITIKKWSIKRTATDIAIKFWMMLTGCLNQTASR